jgi:hypothetical protein
MGNSTSSNEANFSFTLNQEDLFNGGSQLHGTLYLNIDKDSISADNLNLKFYGLESTSIEYEVNVGEDTSTRHEKKDYQLICIDCVLFRFNGQATRGRYAYPFSFNLPVGLPGSQGSRIIGNCFFIEYFLEAKLHRNGMMVWDCKKTLDIVIKDPPYYSTKIPSALEPISKPVYFCGCFKTGTMTLIANIDSTNVFTDEIFQIDYIVQNNSSSKVLFIEIDVREIHHFRADIRSYNKTSTVHKQRIRGTTGPSSFDICFQNMRPSYIGRLGSVEYVIDVRVITHFLSTSFLSKLLVVSIPIVVLRNRKDLPSTAIDIETYNRTFFPDFSSPSFRSG